MLEEIKVWVGEKTTEKNRKSSKRMLEFRSSRSSIHSVDTMQKIYDPLINRTFADFLLFGAKIVVFRKFMVFAGVTGLYG
jgi:hypothetical protein